MTTRAQLVRRRSAAGRKAHAVRARMDAHRGTRPTPRQVDYLRAIGVHQRSTVDLAASLDVGVHTAGEMVRRLERGGWVQRVQTRRRSRLAELTFDGLAAMLLEGARAFADEMREQGIHLGLGSPPVCVVCDVPYPCSSTSAGRGDAPPCVDES